MFLNATMNTLSATLSNLQLTVRIVLRSPCTRLPIVLLRTIVGMSHPPGTGHGLIDTNACSTDLLFGISLFARNKGIPSVLYRASRVLTNVRLTAVRSFRFAIRVY